MVSEYCHENNIWANSAWCWQYGYLAISPSCWVSDGRSIPCFKKCYLRFPGPYLSLWTWGTTSNELCCPVEYREWWFLLTVQRQLMWAVDLSYWALRGSLVSLLYSLGVMWDQIKSLTSLCFQGNNRSICSTVQEAKLHMNIKCLPFASLVFTVYADISNLWKARLHKNFIYGYFSDPYHIAGIVVTCCLLQLICINEDTSKIVKF